MMTLLLTTFILLLNHPTFAQDVITIEELRHKKEILQNSSLQDRFQSHANSSLQASTELEHLFSLRSPVLTGGAAAGSFLHFLEDVSFRARGFGNTNSLLGLPYESFNLNIRPGPHSGDVIHGSTHFHWPQVNKRRLSLLSDFESFYRLQANGRAKKVKGHILVEDSWGWRDHSAQNKIKIGLSGEIEAAHFPLSYSLYYYNVDQDTAGYSEDYKDKSLIKSSNLTNAQRKANGYLAQFKMGRENNHFIFYTRLHEMDFNMHWFPTSPQEINKHRSYGIKFSKDSKWNSSNYTLINILSDFTKGELNEFQEQPTRFSFIQGEHYSYEVESRRVQTNLKHLTNWNSPLSTELGITHQWVSLEYNNKLEEGSFGRYLRLSDQENIYSLLSPYASLLYNPNLSHELSLRLNSSQRIQEVNDLYRRLEGQVEEELPAERISSISLNWSYQNDQISFKNSLYYMVKKNFYFRDADGENVLGETRHYGLESDLLWQFNAYWDMQLSIALGDHTYQFDNPVNASANQNEAITKDNTIDTAIPFQASTQINWSPLSGDRFSLRYLKTSSYYLDAANEHKYSGHSIFDFSYTKKVKNWLLSFAIKNVFDTRYATRADYFRGSYRYFPGRPRHYLSSIHYIF